MDVLVTGHPTCVGGRKWSNPRIMNKFYFCTYVFFLNDEDVWVKQFWFLQNMVKVFKKILSNIHNSASGLIEREVERLYFIFAK